MFKPIFKEMFHPSKAAIISSLKRSDGLPVSEVAKEVEMSYMGVKQHCINLEKMGFVESWRVPRKDVGRPEKLYRLTDKANSLFPVAGAEVTIDLLENAKSLFGEDAPEKLLLNYFEKKKATWKLLIENEQTLEEKVAKFSSLREEDGFFNSISVDENNDLVIKEYHNPMHSIYELYPQAQNYELEMIEDLLDTKVRRNVFSGPHGQQQSIFEIAKLKVA